MSALHLCAGPMLKWDAVGVQGVLAMSPFCRCVEQRSVQAEHRQVSVCWAQEVCDLLQLCCGSCLGLATSEIWNHEVHISAPSRNWFLGEDHDGDQGGLF